MLAFDRPRRPNGIKEKSDALLDELGHPESDNWPKFQQNFWQGLKKYFMKSQHQKCGYCEVQVSDDGDVEHYRPKSVIQELEAEGTELENLRNLRGRKKPEVTEHGYWWLAYEWSNYLLSCSICNQKYKSALFPVSLPRRERSHHKYKFQNPEKIDVRREQPLLINPFEKNLDPYEYFEYAPSGFIKPRDRSKRGLETIRVCGLHRISLTRIRGIKASNVWANSLQLLEAEPKSILQRILAVNLFFEGHEINSFAGMTRIIFKQITGLSWEELEALLIKENWMGDVEDRVTIALSILEENTI